ncbi:thiamine pyrophosphate-binding protein [Butyrivibrio sp. AD3002]|uniref:thiamine pyrophosphate-binding protein n=1 Tax=Butyrivibrio sp. AD3002 TaxID=1280670 RepID=UPI0003B4F5F5|nr:thiamine pyrophosphate-binding protein [Butyrivibrio sp. AD3002]
MNVAEYVMNFLENKGVKHLFMLSGGGIMYLVDAAGRSKIDYVCCHHEQAAGIAAQAYAMKKNDLGVCMITTGPGGTNALTALGAAYTDSTPVLFLSGQVKRADFASLRKVRQFGAQENDIISMAKPVAKYAVTVMEPEKIRYHMEKAVHEAMTGRRGPVWIDIPLDVQNSEINPEKLEGYNAADDKKPLHFSEADISKKAKELCEDLRVCKRPLFIIGHGLVADGTEDIFLKINELIKAPVVATWRALDVMDYDDPYFFGSPGLQAPRYSNIITQGADLVVVLGSRLDNMITAFNEKRFALRADKKFIVDVDENEIDKLDMPGKVKIVSGIAAFLEALCKELEKMQTSAPEADAGYGKGMLGDYSQWLRFCHDIKDKYPILAEKQTAELPGVDLYKLSIKLSEKCKKDDTIVISSTSRCNTAGHMAFNHKKGQRTISSMAFGSMGFALPSVVGAYFAADKNRVICIEGDGSLQLNIQELQTIVHHRMDAKIFVFSNIGYAAIATMQDRNFGGFHVGCDKGSGLSLPDMSKIADAYGIKYYSIADNSDIDETLEKVMNLDGPVICEFFGSILFDEIPKCISSLDENGKRVSAALENPFPFLSEEEMKGVYSEIDS